MLEEQSNQPPAAIQQKGEITKAHALRFFHDRRLLFSLSAHGKYLRLFGVLDKEK
jgi:hypothetical protein